VIVTHYHAMQKVKKQINKPDTLTTTMKSVKITIQSCEHMGDHLIGVCIYHEVMIEIDKFLWLHRNNPKTQKVLGCTELQKFLLCTKVKRTQKIYYCTNTNS
jgi:hypothetical protein